MPQSKKSELIRYKWNKRLIELELDALGDGLDEGHLICMYAERLEGLGKNIGKFWENIGKRTEKPEKED